LLTEELESVFNSAPAKPTAVMVRRRLNVDMHLIKSDACLQASRNVRDTFDKVMGKTENKEGEEDELTVKRKPIEDSMW